MGLTPRLFPERLGVNEKLRRIFQDPCRAVMMRLEPSHALSAGGKNELRSRSRRDRLSR